jgi:hypothetical protein
MRSGTYNQTSLEAKEMGGFKNGTNGVAVIIDTNGTIVGLDTTAERSGSGSRVRDEVVRGLGADGSNELYNCLVSFHGCPMMLIFVVF